MTYPINQAPVSFPGQWADERQSGHLTMCALQGQATRDNATYIVSSARENMNYMNLSRGSVFSTKDMLVKYPKRP